MLKQRRKAQGAAFKVKDEELFTFQENGMNLDPRIARFLERFDQEQIPADPPNSLPLLNKLRDTYSGHRAFSGIDVLFIQHHLGPLVPRIKGMIEDGLDPCRCWFVDVPYSTNLEARQEIRKLGCPEGQAAELFSDPLAPYMQTQQIRVTKALQEVAGRKDPLPLLVLDDGANFVRCMAQFHQTDRSLAEAFRHSRVIEQTTRGHRYLLELGGKMVEAYDFRAVSIARCQTKLRFESPFIGAGVAKALMNALEEQRGGGSRLENIAVIGFGPVGKATTQALIKKLPGRKMDVVDIDPQTHAEIRACGCRPLVELDQEKHYDLVAGCTGYNSFKLHQRCLLADHALLVSGSSAAVEFNREGFIDLADRLPDDEIRVLNRKETQESGIHASITLQHEGKKQFTFLNAGFPVNFDGKMENLPTRAIRATHGLMYAAARQVLQTEKKGFGKIDPTVDEWLYDHALQELESP